MVHFATADTAFHQRGQANDHLAPPNRADEKVNSYQRLLLAKLGVTPFDCGRVVDASSFGPEILVSVHSRMQDGRRAYYVTSSSPEGNLWQRTYSLRRPGNAESTRIRRIDAEIPESVALEIKEVWLRMLRRARPSPPLGLEFEIQGYLEFSIQQSNSHSVHGQLQLPASGPKTQTLAEISDDLWKYCQAAPTNRHAIADKIDKNAKRLLESLRE